MITRIALRQSLDHKHPLHRQVQALHHLIACHLLKLQQISCFLLRHNLRSSRKLNREWVLFMMYQKTKESSLHNWLMSKIFLGRQMHTLRLMWSALRTQLWACRQVSTLLRYRIKPSAPALTGTVFYKEHKNISRMETHCLMMNWKSSNILTGQISKDMTSPVLWEIRKLVVLASWLLLTLC